MLSSGGCLFPPHTPYPGPTGSAGLGRGLEGPADVETIFSGMWISLWGPTDTCSCKVQAPCSPSWPRGTDTTIRQEAGSESPSRGLRQSKRKRAGLTHAVRPDSQALAAPHSPMPETGTTARPRKGLSPHLSQGAPQRPPSNSSSQKLGGWAHL